MEKCFHAGQLTLHRPHPHPVPPLPIPQSLPQFLSCSSVSSTCSSPNSYCSIIHMTFLCFLQTPPTTHLKWEQVFPQHPMDLSVAHLQLSTYPHTENKQVCPISGQVDSVLCATHFCVWIGPLWRLQYGTTCALPSPSPPALLTLLLPVARDGTSQDGTDEGGIVGDDGGAGSRCDVAGGNDADDGANTSAECEEDEDDHTPSPSQPSEHLIYECFVRHTVLLCLICVREKAMLYGSTPSCVLSLSFSLSNTNGFDVYCYFSLKVITVITAQQTAPKSTRKCLSACAMIAPIW